ncbi:N(4)-(beta-N-acetylglucosaminyl)-L-asparaginase [Frateuria aurantia]
MSDRRSFLKQSMIGAASLALAGPTLARAAEASGSSGLPAARPRVISTWNFGDAANQGAWAVLSKGGRALDAVEQGVKITESDLNNRSVGLGGYPDRDGHVTLDASIMDGNGDCGAVAALQDIAHPISVARAVMEKTPHVLLVGDGALEFALSQGFKRSPFSITPGAVQAWKEWLKTSRYHPVANSEESTYGLGKHRGDIHNHDTIGMLAIDAHGQLAGACTTSGMAWKLAGRVGDSPIIGAGLFVDNEVGAATSTGVGEEVIRSAGSFLVVELMRQGRSPQDACREAVERIVRKRPELRHNDTQVAFIAINRAGETGAWAIQPGFEYAICDGGDRHGLIKSASVLSA